MTALVLTLSKIVRILRLDLKVSTTQRDFPIAKGPHKFFNYEFPKDVAGRKFLTCYLVCNVNYPRERWWKRNGRCRPTQAGKIGYFASVASFYPKFLLRYPLFFSERPSASVRLSAHEKSGCHLRASAQWFVAEQRVTTGCSFDTIHHFYHLPFHQTFIVFCLFASEKR